LYSMTFCEIQACKPVHWHQVLAICLRHELYLGLLEGQRGARLLTGGRRPLAPLEPPLCGVQIPENLPHAYR